MTWLENDGYPHGSAILMHKGIKYLMTGHFSPELPPAPSFVSYVCTHIPQLFYLDLRMDGGVSRATEGEIARMLGGLPNLRKLVFLEHHLTSRMVSELSEMRHLTIIRIEYAEELLPMTFDLEDTSFARALAEASLLHIDRF